MLIKRLDPTLDGDMLAALDKIRPIEADTTLNLDEFSPMRTHSHRSDDNALELDEFMVEQNLL